MSERLRFRQHRRQQTDLPSQQARPYRVYDPTLQADEIQLHDERVAVRRALEDEKKHEHRRAPIVQAPGGGQARAPGPPARAQRTPPASKYDRRFITIPVQVHMYPFQVVIPGANQPVLLIPENADRLIFQLSNTTGGSIFISYRVASTTGILVTNNSTFTNGNAGIPIDDIFISKTAAGAVTVMGYEGRFASEANNLP